MYGVNLISTAGEVLLLKFRILHFQIVHAAAVRWHLFGTIPVAEQIARKEKKC
jgi:hypothetical protein